MLPADIYKAHEEGIIHFHDMDYAIQPIYNCCLVNLEDMLQNGTVISGTCIDKPKSFLTACTIASQISAGVSSSQYGGQTMTASHLAPFVNVSREKYRQQVKEELQMAGFTYFEPEQVNEIAEMRVKKEIKDGIQTFMYQVNSIMGSNGQSPFISLTLDINEVPEGQIQDDLALIIEEVLEQRILGMKNEKGVYVTTAFPKLLYVLDENEITNGDFNRIRPLVEQYGLKKITKFLCDKGLNIRDRMILKVQEGKMNGTRAKINYLCKIMKDDLPSYKETKGEIQLESASKKMLCPPDSPSFFNNQSIPPKESVEQKKERLSRIMDEREEEEDAGEEFDNLLSYFQALNKNRKGDEQA